MRELFWRPAAQAIYSKLQQALRFVTGEPYSNMLLTALDLAIIGGYLLTTIAIGLMLKRRASKNLDNYLLGGKQLPWYMLSLSNASGMFDITGTMWLVTLLFVYGLKSIWIPWMWPVFNQIFLMVFLSIWLRRSNVLTGAEWIRTRFGDDTGGKLSHGIVVIFALIGVLGFLVYGFVGIGKFVEISASVTALATLNSASILSSCLRISNSACIFSLAS